MNALIPCVPVTEFRLPDYYDLLHRVNSMIVSGKANEFGSIHIRAAIPEQVPIRIGVRNRVLKNNKHITKKKYKLWLIKKETKDKQITGLYQVSLIDQASTTVNDFLTSVTQETDEKRTILSDLWEQIKVSTEQSPYIWEYATDNNDLLSEEFRGFPMKRMIEDTIVPFLPSGQAFGKIREPYAHYGKRGSSEPMHVEEMNLCSLNVLIAGEENHWLIVPEASRGKVQDLMSQTNRSLYRSHPNHYQCKTIMLSPEALCIAEIPFHQIIQKEGDLVVTLPGAFHQVINLGQNCTVSANFASQGWINYAVTHGYCYCKETCGPVNVGGPKLNLHEAQKLWNLTSNLHSKYDSLFKKRHRCELCLYCTDCLRNYKRHVKSHNQRTDILCKCGLTVLKNCHRSHLKSHWTSSACSALTLTHIKE